MVGQARGIVWANGRTVHTKKLVWWYEVIYRGESVVYDNSTDYDLITQMCRRDVAVFNRLGRLGHSLEYNCSQLVDRAKL